MKHVFIINPVAGKGNGLKLLPQIKEIFEESQEQYIVEITERPGHAEEIARSHAHNGRCRVYSLGGDGTLNEVLNGVAGTDSCIGIIPCGSGNDFIRSVIKEWNPEDILIRTVNGVESCVDIARVNEKYFINIASVGFDAEVVYNAGRFKKIPGISGSLAYIIGIIVTVFKFGGCNLQIEIDNIKINKKLLLAAVANGRYYGGGMLPAPKAEIADGLLDICLVDTMKKIKILALFPRLIKGTHIHMKEVSFYKGKHIRIKSESSLSINIDGEILRGSEASFEIIPGGVSIIIPK